MPEALYGGAAGGGKSYAALAAAAQYVDTPGYSALLLRSNFPDLNQPDALIPRSKEWWSGRAEWNAQNRRWTFPSGATVTFGYLERDDDVYQYQGAAYQYVGIDELTQHTEFRYRYLFSRLRRPAAGPLASVPLRMRGYTNPGGRGHDWVKARFIDPKTRAAGAVFVPAKLADNPSLDAGQYRQGLAQLDPFTRRQLEEGDWDAVAGGRFRREWFRRYTRRGDYYLLDGRPVLHADLRLVFLTADTAASTSRSADCTVISVWGITRDNQLLWLDCFRGRLEVPDIIPEIERLHALWRPEFVGIEVVGAHSGAGIYQALKRTRMAVKAFHRRAGEDKLARATQAILLAESGRLWLPLSAPWLDECEAELVRFTGDPQQDSHDDVVDTLSDAAAVLTGYDDQQARGFTPYVAGR